MSFMQSPKLLKSDHLSFTPQTSKKDQKFINFLDDYINYMNTTSTKKKESEREKGDGRTDEGWRMRGENRMEEKRLKRSSKEDEEKVEGEGRLEEGEGEREDEEEYYEGEREDECEEEGEKEVEEGLAEDVAFLRAAALKYRRGWEKERERRSQLEEKYEEGRRRNERIIQIKLMRKDQQIIDLQQEISKLKETVNLARKLLLREKIDKEKKKFTIQKLLIERKAFKSQNYYHICSPNENNANVDNSSFENDNTDVKISRPKKRDKFYASFHQPKNSLDISSNNNLHLASSEMEPKRNPQIYFTPKVNKSQTACDKLQKSIKNIRNNQTLIEKLAGKKSQKKLV